MKVYVIYHNEGWDYSAPFAVFSTKELAKAWIRDTKSDISHGIQELELDHSPEDWMETVDCGEEYWSTCGEEYLRKLEDFSSKVNNLNG